MLQNNVNRNWQAGLPRPKFSYESLFPRPLYRILSPKSEKKNFATRKLLRALKLLRFVSGRVLFRFLSERIESSLCFSVTESSLGYSVKGSFLSPQRRLFLRVFSDRFLSWIISLLFPEWYYFFIKTYYGFSFHLPIKFFLFKMLWTLSLYNWGLLQA